MTITYDLSLAPDGMTVDPNTGLTAWRPTIDQVGEHLVILRATNASGSISLHDFYVEVTAPNTAPVIVTPAASVVGSQRNQPLGISPRFPAPTAFVGLSYTHDVIAQDAESTNLAFALTSAPTGASIDPTTGRLSWTPAASAVGSHEFTVTVTDEVGATTSATWTVDVKNESPAVLPLNVSSTTNNRRSHRRLLQPHHRDRSTGTSGELGAYPVDRTGLTVDADGTLRWTPASDQLGTQTVEFTATTADGTSEPVFVRHPRYRALSECDSLYRLRTDHICLARPNASSTTC